MRRWLIGLIVLLWATPVWAACGGSSPTWTAANATKAEVAACVTAASAGDTINVPAGSETWDGAVTIGKALSIIGAGSGVGGTILTGSGSLDSGFFYVTGFSSDSPVRISGFRFVMSGVVQKFGIKIEAVTLTALRIDHNAFEYGNVQIQVGGAKGVIDHNTLSDADIAISFTAGSRSQADASWVSMAAGTSDALFIETNEFIDTVVGSERIGTYNGGKLVVRYNDFDSDAVSSGISSTPFMAHGSAAGGAAYGYWQASTETRRGQSVIEFYHNTIHGPRIDFLYTSRGSANLVHHNVIANHVTNAPRIYFYEEENYETQWSPLRTAWPAEDQVHNSFIWANTYDGSAYFDQDDHIGIGAYSGDYIQKNRDFFLHEPQATGGKASFTGANGASGSYPTNGVVYPTLGTMTFSASGANEYYGYTTYTYPHPLTGATAPNAPTNVRIR